MSQEPHSHEEGPIQTPKQLIVAVALAFVLPVFIIALLVNYVNSSAKDAAGSNALSPEAVAQRIMPVAKVEVKAASLAPGANSGETVYKAQCSACHAAGALGSPKFGDAAAWGPRIGQGLETLWNAAMKGKNAMPAQGGGEFTGDEIKRAVAYMANAGGAKFEAPAAGANSAPAADAAASTETAATPAAPATPVAAAATPTAAPAVVAGSAEPALYAASCAACHATGVMNAPKLGDKAAWAPRLAAGIDGLARSAIKGKNMMPPKGGAGNASADEIKAVVSYMVSKVK